MAKSERGQELHERYCNGEQLTSDERAELDAWYSRMDAEEAAMLNLNSPASSTNEVSRAELRARLCELQDTLGEIRGIEERNEILRQQNEELKRQLVSKGILAA
jgi:type IV pilus biogenesis protein CpaD/CtpE